MKESIRKMLNLIGQVIYDRKGFNILALNVQGLSSITDYMLIAEGNVDRHGHAIARSIIDQMKEQGADPLHTEGLKEGDWIVLDYGEVMVHIFSKPGLREKYSLERLWDKSEIVDLSINVSNKVM
jgi:ribosome-associated protein